MLQRIKMLVGAKGCMAVISIFNQCFFPWVLVDSLKPDRTIAENFQLESKGPYWWKGDKQRGRIVDEKWALKRQMQHTIVWE